MEHIEIVTDKTDVIEFLKDHRLIERIQEDLNFFIIGESRIKLLAYLIATSRKQPYGSTLAGTFKGSSSAGKSYITEKVKQLMPKEEVVSITNLSPKALYYYGEDHLKNKLVIISEAQGKTGAEYAIRNLLSEPYIVSSIPLKKDDKTGEMKTKEFKVNAPIAYLDTTTRSKIHPENATRVFELYLTETPEQTKEINIHQAKMAGIDYFAIKQREKEIFERHRNLQTLLHKDIIVLIPYAKLISFPPAYLRARRDFPKLLNIIKTIAFLYQYQRDIKEKGRITYIEATPEDYKYAYVLAQNTFLETLDILDKRERKILEVIEKNIHATKTAFTRNDISNWMGIDKSHLVQHLISLEQKEYLLIEGSGGIGQKRIYKYNRDLIQKEQDRFGFKGLTTYEELKKKLNK